MSIDKDSTGLPEVNLHHAETRINFALVAGVVLFLALMAGAAYVIFW